jgi:xylulokinase
MQWSDEIINAAGLDKSLFPQIKPSTHVVGVVSQSVGYECGLAAGTKIILGGGDGSCASVGAGSISEGITYNCLGTSSWISTVSKKPFYDEQMRTVTWAHVIPDMLIPSGTMQTAGAAFGWAAERMYGAELALDKESAYAQINKDMALASAGSNALIFLPYLLGERCPRWNSNARGSFIGLKMEHTRGDMMRSVMEGVAMNLNIILGILKGAVEIKEMLIVGGLAQGEVNQQILSDVYGMGVARLKHLEEATSIGAAVIAGVGAGVLPGFESASDFNRIESRKQAITSNSKIYSKMQEIFDSSYQSQLEIHEQLAGI